MTPVALAFGANLGNPHHQIDQAIHDIIDRKILTDTKVSTFIQTKPAGGPPQPDYVNAVMTGNTRYDPLSLLQKMQELENQAGRTREIRWGPRTLDIDLLLYNDQIIHTKGLIVPHPRMHVRRFVLEPLAEIAPLWVHPERKMTVLQLLERLRDVGDSMDGSGL